MIKLQKFFLPLLLSLSIFFIGGIPAINAQNNLNAGNNNAGTERDDCTFGEFESGLIDGCIDDYIRQQQGNSLVAFIQLIINFVTGLVVTLGLISIVIGGYFYMTAGGSSDRISTAKTWIVSALSGIILALVSWLILNTISSQFTNPEVPLPSPTPAQQRGN